jgi:hypothetical protein
LERQNAAARKIIKSRVKGAKYNFKNSFADVNNSPPSKMMGPEVVLEEMETPPRDKTKNADDVGNIKTASISGVS